MMVWGSAIVGGVAAQLAMVLLMHPAMITLSAAGPSSHGAPDTEKADYGHFVLNNCNPEFYKTLCDPHEKVLRPAFRIACFRIRETPRNLWDCAPKRVTGIIVTKKRNIDQLQIMDEKVRNTKGVEPSDLAMYRELTLQVARLILEEAKSLPTKQRDDEDKSDVSEGEEIDTDTATKATTPVTDPARRLSLLLTASAEGNKGDGMERLLKECLIMTKELCRGHTNHAEYMGILFPNFGQATRKATVKPSIPQGTVSPPRGDAKLDSFGTAHKDILIQYAQKFLVSQPAANLEFIKKADPNNIWSKYSRSRTVLVRFLNDTKTRLSVIMSPEHYKALSDAFSKYAEMTGRAPVVTQSRSTTATVDALKATLVKVLKDEVTIDRTLRLYGTNGTRAWFVRVTHEYHAGESALSRP
ncbi:diaminopimelate aminotransferase, putative [Babesia ovata]|uniref:Diaminopimelate aminotransferase, putative n=1 Tax=Babesia ovata TaxID=189622 RepID=A0A2H6KAV7_9APIC|nr:diaminopimelate aminotransferase, putative [Babesia ovata]GBE60116.1 diaminopimelate aminotransferase, putative [Babesia ovata]